MSKKKVLCKSIFQKSKFLSVYYLDELHGFVGEKQEIHQKNVGKIFSLNKSFGIGVCVCCTVAAASAATII